MNLYEQKYLKYKNKYELLKKQIGGNRRILYDLKNLKKNPLSGIIVEPVEGNLFLLHGTITGSPGTPYEGYMWEIRMNIPQDYPFKPPTFNFVGDSIYTTQRTRYIYVVYSHALSFVLLSQSIPFLFLYR